VLLVSLQFLRLLPKEEVLGLEVAAENAERGGSLRGALYYNGFGVSPKEC
jgi:hypothetical protein